MTNVERRQFVNCVSVLCNRCPFTNWNSAETGGEPLVRGIPKLTYFLRCSPWRHTFSFSGERDRRETVLTEIDLNYIQTVLVVFWGFGSEKDNSEENACRFIEDGFWIHRSCKECSASCSVCFVGCLWSENMADCRYDGYGGIWRRIDPHAQNFDEFYGKFIASVNRYFWNHNYNARLYVFVNLVLVKCSVSGFGSILQASRH